MWLARLKKHMRVFQNDFRVASSHRLPIDELLKNVQESMRCDFQEIKQEVRSLPDFEDRCREFLGCNARFSSEMDEILRMQTVLGEYFLWLQKS